MGSIRIRKCRILMEWECHKCGNAGNYWLRCETCEHWKCKESHTRDDPRLSDSYYRKTDWDSENPPCRDSTAGGEMPGELNAFKLSVAHGRGLVTHTHREQTPLVHHSLFEPQANGLRLVPSVFHLGHGQRPVFVIFPDYSPPYSLGDQGLCTSSRC